MYTPAAKRRRIDDASKTLSKPFRSPFKTPFKSPVKAQDGTTTTPTSKQLTPASKLVLSNNPPKLPTTPLNLNRTPRSATRKKQFSSPISTAVLNADPAIAPLLKTQRDLERELKELKEELDTAEQARKIERESTDEEVDGELKVLIEKWRGASREAAEEMFGRVRDRVNRMGGPRAWKEMQKKQQEFQGQWEDEQNNNADDDDDEDEDDEEAKERAKRKRELYDQYDIEIETENEKSQREKRLGDTGERPGEEDEFTMAMMLRTLNVDLDVIGYDRDQQRWVD
ncbi:hypothetical protein HYALB_00010860 [Hymenoscyphus albidus]|uniref:DNA repair protein Dds20/Mei5 n=1 Tax=Hymenoscyphus albidus TaxID=595503 RepID=A0A9N9Q449_9HELO|nr:hypothetical protein HYALB_00010860 [Hymenoscyphus albidus]